MEYISKKVAAYGQFVLVFAIFCSTSAAQYKSLYEHMMIRCFRQAKTNAFSV